MRAVISRQRERAHAEPRSTRLLREGVHAIMANLVWTHQTERLASWYVRSHAAVQITSVGIGTRTKDRWWAKNQRGTR